MPTVDLSNFASLLTFSPNTILHGGGLLGIILVAIVIFAETGLFFGFIFPGDSLLLIAGYFASQGKISLGMMLPVVMLAAIIGYETGYELGRRFGPRIFKREDGLFFKKEYVERTQAFFGQHGGKTILLARFVPYVRTFVSAIAGVAEMNRQLFVIYNIIGGIFWVGAVTMAGYWLGQRIPAGFDTYVVLAVVAGLVLFHGGTFWHVWRDEHRRASFKKAIAEEFNHFFRRKRA